MKTKLTPEEEKAWVNYFGLYVDSEGMTDEDADLAAWRDMQNEFPRLKQFDGCEVDAQDTIECPLCQKQFNTEAKDNEIVVCPHCRGEILPS